MENGRSGGIGIGYLLLIAFLAYAVLKFYATQQQIAADISNRGAIQPGVSYYCNLAVSQRPHQVLAAQGWNSCATSFTYAPSLGPNENMPSQRTEVFF
jgi:hypothetical protein